MAFKLGDVIVDRLQFGYGAKSNGTPLYALTQLTQANIDITADSTDINDKDGNLVYRKYTGKKGEVTATNAFLNLAVVEAISATDAEIATADKGIVMPMIQIVKAGETLDITDYVDGSIHVNALSPKGSMGKDEFAKGSKSSATEYGITHTDEVKDPGDQHVITPASDVLTPPTADGETQYIVKYKKTVTSGAKITNSGKKFPKAHELFFKALVVDKCENEVLKAAIIHIPSFMPSPEFTLALQGGDSQTMDYKGAMMLNACSTDAELFSIYYIDEEEDDIEL
jgi:hypothetical protein